MYKYIGGAPRCGKTTFSNKIALAKNIEIIHLDNYRNKIFKNLEENDKIEFFNIFHFLKKQPIIHKKTLNFLRKNGFNIELAKKFGIHDALETYIQKYGLDKYFIEEFKNGEFITKNIFEDLENFQDKIIEGVSLSPKIIYDFSEKGKIKKDEVVFLVKSNKDEIKNILENCPGSFANRDIKNMVDLILKYGEKIEKEATNLGLKVMDTSKKKIF